MDSSYNIVLSDDKYSEATKYYGLSLSNVLKSSILGIFVLIVLLISLTNNVNTDYLKTVLDTLLGFLFITIAIATGINLSVKSFVMWNLTIDVHVGYPPYILRMASNILKLSIPKKSTKKERDIIQTLEEYFNKYFLDRMFINIDLTPLLFISALIVGLVSEMSLLYFNITALTFLVTVMFVSTTMYFKITSLIKKTLEFNDEMIICALEHHPYHLCLVTTEDLENGYSEDYPLEEAKHIYTKIMKSLKLLFLFTIIGGILFQSKTLLFATIVAGVVNFNDIGSKKSVSQLFLVKYEPSMRRLHWIYYIWYFMFVKGLINNPLQTINKMLKNTEESKIFVRLSTLIYPVIQFMEKISKIHIYALSLSLDLIIYIVGIKVGVLLSNILNKDISIFSVMSFLLVLSYNFYMARILHKKTDVYTSTIKSIFLPFTTSINEMYNKNIRAISFMSFDEVVNIITEYMYLSLASNLIGFNIVSIKFKSTIYPSSYLFLDDDFKSLELELKQAVLFNQLNLSAVKEEIINIIKKKYIDEVIIEIIYPVGVYSNINLIQLFTKYPVIKRIKIKRDKDLYHVEVTERYLFEIDNTFLNYIFS